MTKSRLDTKVQEKKAAMLQRSVEVYDKAEITDAYPMERMKLEKAMAMGNSGEKLLLMLSTRFYTCMMMTI